MTFPESESRFSLASWADDLLNKDRERVLLLSERRKISASELKSQVELWQSALESTGVDRGQVVAISAERTTDSVALFFACAMSGVVPLFVDPRLDRELLVKLLDAIRIQGLFCGSSLDQSTFRARLPYLKWTGEQLPSGQPSRRPRDVDQAASAFAVHTAGTCDLPRALFHADSAAEWQARALVKALRLKSGTQLWFTGTLASSAVLSLGLFATLTAGGTLVLDNPATHLPEQRAVPTQSFMIFAEAKDPQEWGAEKLLSIKGKVASILATDITLEEDRLNVIARATDADLMTGYYCSESAGFLTLNTQPGVWPFESIGRPIGGASLAALDERGRRLPNGRLGRLAAADVPVPVKTVSLSFKGGERVASEWLIPGDWGIVDEQDFAYWLGSEKSVFMRAGFHVLAPEVESSIRTLQGVESALVFAVRNDEIDHDVACVVRLKPDAVAAREIPLKLVDKVPRFMIPGLLAVAEGFPATPGGKSVRYGLSNLGKSVENIMELPPVKLPSAGPVIARRDDDETVDESLPSD